MVDKENAFINEMVDKENTFINEMVDKENTKTVKLDLAGISLAL